MHICNRQFYPTCFAQLESLILSVQEATVGRKRDANEWQDMLKVWERSGSSRAEFCREHDVPVSTFDYWRKKQRDNVDESPRLVKIPRKATAVVEAANIRIIIDGRLSVELRDGFTAENLSTVLQAISLCS